MKFRDPYVSVNFYLFCKLRFSITRIGGNNKTGDTVRTSSRDGGSRSCDTALRLTPTARVRLGNPQLWRIWDAASKTHQAVIFGRRGT